jgi:TolA-binding protein
MATAPETPVDTSNEFDFPLFWEEHKTKILIAAAVFVIALASWAAWQVVEHRRETAARTAYASASTADDYKRIAEQFGGSVVGGNALLVLAEKQRTEGKFDDAIATLRQFQSRHAEHPLASSGAMALAATLDAKGSAEEAIEAYQQVIARFPREHVAPMALLAQAELQKRRGEKAEARRLFEKIIADYGETLFAQEATRSLSSVQD